MVYSPDLNSWDYFLWGQIEYEVYRDPEHDLRDLESKIRREIQSMNVESLRKVDANMKTGLNFVIYKNGEASSIL